jgi:deazaflavin-dependent oxidoreductase (nitroreductase family)
MRSSFVLAWTIVTSRVLQRSVRYFNPVARFFLASRLHALMSGRLVLLTFTGRRTGRAYTTPVSYVREGNTLLLPAGGGWWKNLRDGPRTRVRLRGTRRQAIPELITEPVAVAEVLRRMLAANPAISVFTGVRPGPDGRPDAEALDREQRRGFVVVRLHLDGEGARLSTGA